MMRILFCNIAWMKEYRGNEDGKEHVNGIKDSCFIERQIHWHRKYLYSYRWYADKYSRKSRIIERKK